MIYLLLVIGALFLFAIMSFDVSAKLSLTLLIETFVVMAAAYFVIGKVTFISALKAVGLSTLLFIVAGAFMLPALDGAGALAVPITVIVTFGAAIWGIGLGLQATFSQVALIGVIFTGIYWASSSLLGLGSSISGTA